jgi:Family of unknown function (DUF6516)
VDDTLAEWLYRVEACLLAWSQSRQVAMEYAETGHGVAQYRCRVTLLDGSLLQCVERVRLAPDGLQTERYSFHWQRATGQFICRWDNAPHHRELPNFPNHLHFGDENNVAACEPMDICSVIEAIDQQLAKHGE